MKGRAIILIIVTVVFLFETVKISSALEIKATDTCCMNMKADNNGSKEEHCPMHKKHDKKSMNCLDCPLCTLITSTPFFHSSEITSHFIEAKYPGLVNNPVYGFKKDCWKPPKEV